jgi:hypothetical protein
LLAVGCKPKAPPAFDADAKSGPDGKRVGARSLLPNNPMTDQVDYAGQDQTDWYMVQLPGKPGVLTADVSWASATADVAIDIFDEAGTQLAASAPSPGAKAKTLLAKIEKVPGTYFIRVWAANQGDATTYTLTAKWELPPEPVATPEEPPPPPPVHKKEKKEKPARAEKDAMPKSESSIQGRIVSAYREGEGLTLQIDKGSSAGIKAGMRGTVLQGSAGEDALDGGDFQVKEVVGPTKCLASTGLKAIGKNTRVVITLGR